jgi:hypothetical protein
MQYKKYEGIYELRIFLADSAWSEPKHTKSIKEGSIEKILIESRGVENFFKGRLGCQNIALINNSENVLALIKKLDALPYIGRLTLSKYDLSSREGYISPSG